MGTSSIIIMLSSVITSYATHVDKLLSSIQDPFQLSIVNDWCSTTAVLCADRQCRAVVDALNNQITDKLPSYIHLEVECGTISGAAAISSPTTLPTSQLSSPSSATTTERSPTVFVPTYKQWGNTRVWDKGGGKSGTHTWATPLVIMINNNKLVWGEQQHVTFTCRVVIKSNKQERGETTRNVYESQGGCLVKGEECTILNCN